MRPSSRTILLLILGSWISLSCLRSQTLFEAASPLSLILEADWASFLTDRGDSADYYPAALFMHTATDSLEMPLRIRVRGNFRRKSAICEIPPIRLRFRQHERENTLFTHHKKLKLVSSCQGESYVIREYLAYKIFQLISPHSYAVRLAQVQYRDPAAPTEAMEYMGFLIEDEDRLAERLGHRLVEHSYPPDTAIEATGLVRLALFAYLIGNMDWDVPTEKNLSYLQADSLAALIPVPYDFDWSALVNAPYTMLPPGFERRVLRPIIRDEALARQVWQEFLALEGAVDQLLKEFSHLPKVERKVLRQYCRGSFRRMRKADFWKGLLISDDAP